MLRLSCIRSAQWLTVTLLAFGFGTAARAQAPIFSETFETGTLGGFTAVNGSQTNTWVVGPAAGNGSSSGTQAAYISDDAGAYTYTVTGAGSIVHLYRDVTFPAGQTAILLSFDWKGQGEANADDLRVFLVPTTTTPTAGTALTAAALGTYSLHEGFIRTTLVLPATAAGTTQRLVFSWRNDPDGGIQPPAALDNILLTSKAAAALCGTKTVGPGATTYKTLGEALNDVNVSGLCGPLTLELQRNYESSVEAFTPTYTYAGGSATNTVTIRPAADAAGLSLSSTAAQTLSINGGRYLLVDGQPGGSGASVSGPAATSNLLLANTSTSGVAVQLAGNAAFNTIQHCLIRGVGTAATLGAVTFASLSPGSGNSDNTLRFNTIGEAATTPSVLVYSGSANNSRNNISNNDLSNFYGSGSAYGIFLSAAGNGWIINGNSLYQTVIRAAVSGTLFGINIGGGNGHTITSNFIGGTAPGAAGTALTVTGAAAYRFCGIFLTPTAGTATSVQDNTIANINWTTSSTAATTYGGWGGIYSAASNSTVTIGTVAGNTIGSADGPVTVVGTGTSTTVMGISLGASAAASVAKNSISNLSATGTTASINGMLVAGGTANSIFRNTIHSLAVGAGRASQVIGIRLTSGTTNTLTNNLLGDFRAPASTSLTALAGVQINGGTTTSLYYNTIYLNAASTGATFGTRATTSSSTNRWLLARAATR
jgi:hypothetical protein